MSVIQFEHKMAAHCESGTLAALLNHAGMKVSEPMIFGIAGAIFFAYLKSPKFTFPQFVVRSKPGDIRIKTEKRLGVRFSTTRFGKPEKARRALDELLDKKIPAGIQVDMFHMDYIPPYMRVHFNGHFITVVGSEEGKYIVSDCYYPTLVPISVASLDTARFTRGDLAPKGFQFYPATVPGNVDWAAAAKAGIKQASYYMVKVPVPFIGAKSIRKFASDVMEWPKLTRDVVHLSDEIMMIHIALEERGTGGAGFRFMYATFLQEASKLLPGLSLDTMAKRMMENGDKWREISLFVARIAKARDLGENKLKELKELIMARADWEEAFFLELWNAVRK
jgi:hypothetical protein